MDTETRVHQHQIEEAQRLILQARERREQACLDEIQAVLARYGCELRAMLIIENGQIEQRVRVAAL